VTFRDSEVQDDGEALWEWSVFWRSDQAQSCMPVASATDADQLRDEWRDFFESLAGGAKILDLGTGNGSLAAQAVSVSLTKPQPFSVHGVDLADIQPTKFVSSGAELLKNVEFHPRTSMEQLPFEDETFDAVLSQYAIEYSNTAKSLAEAIRVLRPGGNFRFLLHADDGAQKKRCELQCRQVDTILESSLFVATIDLLRILVLAEATNKPEHVASAETSIATLQVTLEELEATFLNDDDHSLPDNLFAAVRSLPALRKSHDIEALLRMTEDVRSLLTAQAIRLRAMQQAALDGPSIDAFADQLRQLHVDNTRYEKATTGELDYCVGYWMFGSKTEGGGLS
jgi:ubiquinone/menaquinone biosynthesis C-methylase UbiE